MSDAAVVSNDIVHERQMMIANAVGDDLKARGYSGFKMTGLRPVRPDSCRKEGWPAEFTGRKISVGLKISPLHGAELIRIAVGFWDAPFDSPIVPVLVGTFSEWLAEHGIKPEARHAA